MLMNIRGQNASLAKTLENVCILSTDEMENSTTKQWCVISRVHCDLRQIKYVFMWPMICTCTYSRHVYSGKHVNTIPQQTATRLANLDLLLFIFIPVVCVFFSLSLPQPENNNRMKCDISLRFFSFIFIFRFSDPTTHDAQEQQNAAALYSRGEAVLA